MPPPFFNNQKSTVQMKLLHKDKHNLKLWTMVCDTDTAFTKKMEYGAKLTAIDAQYQFLKATEIFGAYGDGWGLKDLKWEYLRDAKGEVMELLLDAVFYYPMGEFEIATDIKYSQGGDCRKKAMTDATTKALSKLGFNADVFMGMFDGNKYAEIRKKSQTHQHVKKVTSEFIAADKQAGKIHKRKALKAIDDCVALGFKLETASGFKSEMEGVVAKWRADEVFNRFSILKVMLENKFTAKVQTGVEAELSKEYLTPQKATAILKRLDEILAQQNTESDG